MKDKKTPVEAILILQNLDAELLRSLAKLASTSEFDALEGFLRRYVETKRNQILDLPTENERHLANEVAIRKGAIYTAGVIIEVLRGAQKELSKRKKD